MEQRSGFARWLIATCALIGLGAAHAAAVEPPSAERLAKALSTPFVSNEGQSHPEVAYYTRTFAGTAFVTRSGELVWSLPGTGERRAVLKEAMGGAAPVSGVALAPLRMNFLLGERQRWRSDVATYRTISLGEKYPGVEVVLQASDSNVEKLFHVSPAGDPASIRVDVKGSSGLRVLDDGRLEIGSATGSVLMSAPLAYQMIGGRFLPVDVAYRLDGSAYGFDVASYDRGHPLVIDPLLASYLGGAEIDEGYAIDVAPDGSGTSYVFVTGNTRSADFPVTTGETYGGGEQDVFVAKLDTEFNALVTTYLGGNLSDSGRDLMVFEPAGAEPPGPRVFVTGFTNSVDFVARETARLESQTDAFVVRLSDDLSSIEASAYVGGSNSTARTNAYAIAAPSTAGQIYITGRTRSSQLTGSDGASGGGADDVFIAVLSAGVPMAVERSVYHGGSFNDQAFDIVLDSDALFVAGLTSSGEVGSTPLPGVGDVPEYAGNEDAFLSKFSLEDLTLIRSTYFGGAERDWAQALLLHSNGNVYVGGGTFSASFAVPPVGTQPAYENSSGSMEAWLASFNPELTGLEGYTFFGGSSRDAIYDLDLLAATGEIMAYGRTQSLDLSDTGGGLRDNGDGFDVFLVRVDPSLSAANQATYYGGSLFDEILGPGLDLTDDPRSGAPTAFVAGVTGSDDLPGVTAESAQSLRGGGNDAFAAKLDASLQNPGPLFASVLPASRAVSTSAVATAFVSLLNAGGTTLSACGIVPTTQVPADFSYQTTDPLTNALTGTPDTPVSIPAGGLQTFVVAFAPTQAFGSTDIIFDFACAEASVAPIVGVNSLLLAASDTPGPDVIALAASPTPGQVLLDSATGAGAFAVATSNVGADGAITVRARSNTGALLTLCETNPAEGVCVNPPAPVASPLPVNIAAGATPTFAVFAFSGEPIAFDPATNRVFFEVVSAGEVVIGATTVAISTGQ